jgi:hypothetical protein
MVGVTSPSFRNKQVREGTYLLSGYVLGTGTAAALIAMSATTLAYAVDRVLPSPGRHYLLAGILLALLVMDLSGRVIFPNRQTPQRARLLPPFVRGVVWGIDIGLLVTTIKITSLVWAMVAIAVVEDSYLGLALLTYYGVNLAAEGVALYIDYKMHGRLFARLQRQSLTVAARLASVTLLAVGTALVVSEVLR